MDIIEKIKQAVETAERADKAAIDAREHLMSLVLSGGRDATPAPKRAMRKPRKAAKVKAAKVKAPKMAKAPKTAKEPRAQRGERAAEILAALAGGTSLSATAVADATYTAGDKTKHYRNIASNLTHLVKKGAVKKLGHGRGTLFALKGPRRAAPTAPPTPAPMPTSVPTDDDSAYDLDLTS